MRSIRCKADAQTVHATRRAVERIGIHLGPIRTRRIIDAIQGRVGPGVRAMFLDRQSNRVTVWSIEIDGEQFRVVYDAIRKTLVTVLPPEGVKA